MSSSNSNTKTVIQLTTEARTRLYCVLVDCPSCNAHRGELCFSGKGNKRWKVGYHHLRGNLVQELRKKNENFDERYRALVKTLMEGK